MKISMDKKYTNGQGETVEVLCVDADGDYPVITKTNGTCETYTINAAYSREQKSAKLDLIEVGDYDHIKIGDPCLGWNQFGLRKMVRGYFSGVNKKGEPTMFNDGTTAWSGSPELVTAWDNVEIPRADQ
jgi:hypothetical protein